MEWCQKGNKRQLVGISGGSCSGDEQYKSQDTSLCLPDESTEWNTKMDKPLQKYSSTIDLLSPKECEKLEELPFTVTAGKVPPKEVVAVVRPANYVSKCDSIGLDQRYICKCNAEMLLEVKFNGQKKDPQNHVYTKRVSPSSNQGVHGIYVFPLGCKFPHLFQIAGLYTFSFSLIDSNCMPFVQKVVVKASPVIGKWKLLRDKKSQPYSVSVGSTLSALFIACYDIYDNRAPFPSTPEVVVKLQADEESDFQVKKIECRLLFLKWILGIRDLMIESSDLDKIRPGYEVTLVISSSDGIFSVATPCHVTPGCLQLVKFQQSILDNQLLPGFIVKELKFEMLDVYGNHVVEGLEVQLDVQGFEMLDQLGPTRKVDYHGHVDLSGLLKVTASYGENVSLSISSDNKVIFKQEFQIEKRELRVASKVPKILTAGSKLENIIFEIVNSEGVVDETIHNEEKTGLSHTLSIKADWLNMEESIHYTFKHGQCLVPAISLPQIAGNYSFLAFHSRHSNLSLNIEVRTFNFAMPIPKLEQDGISSNFQDSNSLIRVGKNFIMSVEKNKKVFEDDMCKFGLVVQLLEEKCVKLNEQKEKVEQTIKEWQDCMKMKPCQLGFSNHLSTKDEVIENIEKIGNSAAAVLCNVSRVVPFQDRDDYLMKDIIGVVALLGRVRSMRLSRILSEYLGADQMLAVVARSFETAVLLEKYKETGEVDRCHALHIEASILDKFIDGRFNVICFDNISPFSGGVKSGSQRKLALSRPRFMVGTIPEGFLGFAVNMIDLDEEMLSIKNNSGHGLRETLFYHLLGQLHVYETREDMLAARACIEHGAVSLDGGILKGNSVMSLGFSDPGVCFQVLTTNSEMLHYQENLKLLNEKKSELRTINDEIEQVMKKRSKVLKKFEKKKTEFNKFMDDCQHIYK